MSVIWPVCDYSKGGKKHSGSASQRSGSLAAMQRSGVKTAGMVAVRLCLGGGSLRFASAGTVSLAHVAVAAKAQSAAAFEVLN